MRRVGGITAPLVVAWLGLGCAEPNEPIATRAQAVVDGALSGPEHDASVMVIFDYDPATPGAFFLSSGVLVAPNLLLTARHNITDIAPSGYLEIGRYSCGDDGEPIDDGTGGGYVVSSGNPYDIKVYVGNVLHDPVTEPPAARGVQIFDDENPTLCSHDIALVLLDREIENVPPVQLRWNTPPAVGELITLVAWGRIDGGDVPYQPRSHYLTGLPITVVGPEQPGGPDTGAMARSFHTGPAGCYGDSGGGAFDTEGRLLGIETLILGTLNPTAPDPCAVSTNATMYLQVPSFRHLIETTFTTVGQTPWLEGSPQPGSVALGEACSADHDCESGACGIDQGEEGTCTTECASDAECTPDQECRGGLCRVPIPELPNGGACALTAPRKTSLWWWFALAFYWHRRRATSACRGRGGEECRSARGD